MLAYNTARDEGFAAYRANKGESDCPYVDCTLGLGDVGYWQTEAARTPGMDAGFLRGVAVECAAMTPSRKNALVTLAMYPDKFLLRDVIEGAYARNCATDNTMIALRKGGLVESKRRGTNRRCVYRITEAGIGALMDEGLLDAAV